MELDIRAGKRILYKKNKNNWHVGELAQKPATLTSDGLFLPVYPQEVFYQIHSTGYAGEEAEYIYVDVKDIFLDAVEVEDWMKTGLLTKEEYIKIIESEDFEKNLEHAWVSDGEYIYYPISKYNKTWIEKQPFNYIIRGE